MLVVTTRASGDPAGCSQGFGIQAGIDPPRFVAGLSEGIYRGGVNSCLDANRAPREITFLFEGLHWQIRDIAVS
jgi:hypothetical protein